MTSKKQPSTYAYPAVFSFSEGLWGVSFPDLDNAFTASETLEQAILEAKCVLEECLYFREEQHDVIPTPTALNKVKASSGDVVQLVVADMTETRREMSQRAVKKTLTIPYWMEEELKKVPTLNVSALLQRAITKELNLKTPVSA